MFAPAVPKGVVPPKKLKVDPNKKATLPAVPVVPKALPEETDVVLQTL